MKKAVKVILIVLAALILAFAAIFIYFRFMKNTVLDGPGSEYTWTDYELYSEWVETDPYDADDPVRLVFGPDSFTMMTSDREQTFRYSLPEGTDVCGQPEGEVYLTLSDCTEFEGLIFHEEQLDGDERIPVLSATIFEYDGRGEIVIVEFVPVNDLEKLPADFRSSSCVSRNDREPVPTVKPVS